MSTYEFFEVKSAVRFDGAKTVWNLLSPYSPVPGGWEIAARSEVPENNGYDEYPQGSEFDVWVVLKHTATNRFYRFSGTMDSYGDKTVSNMGFEVQPTEKKVTVYDFE